MTGPEALPSLHVVTDDAVVARADFLDRAREIVEAGGARVALHLRAPGAAGRRTYDLAVRLAEIARRTGAAFLVNDRVDVALAVEADGVQLGTRSLAPADARRLLGPGRWIGASVHSADEAREAAAGGADFLITGAVYATASHPGRAGQGVRLIEDVAALGRPVIAIGGITPGRAAEVRSAGAAGVAVIRGIWEASSPAEAVTRYLEAWRR